jgi:hypothetical protein
VVGAVLDAALAGNVAAAKWYAERRWPERYGRAALRRETGDLDIPAEARVAPTPTVFDQLAERRRRRSHEHQLMEAT